VWSNASESLGSMSSFLEFEAVSKNFGSVKAVQSVSLGVRKGEFFSLLGPSGCGKTTLLRMVAGFETPDSGRILIDGQDISPLPPNRRKVNTIFQSYALFPHLTVRENVAFGPRVAGWPRERIDEEVSRLLALTELEDQAGKKPEQISGGQKQRVAIARALINNPDVLLLDEPLAALDLKLRQRMLIELDMIHDKVGITFLYVTHDQGEAMSLSDRIAVMTEGRIEQVGPPSEIYEAPRTSFVAAFIGDTNLLEGCVKDLADGNYCRLQVAGFTEIMCHNNKQIRQGRTVSLSLRPEKLRISREKPQPDSLSNVVQGRVEDVIYLGTHTKYWVRVHEHRLAVFEQRNRFLLDETPSSWEQDVWLSWHADDAFILEGDSGKDEGAAS
jgi:spermidine/putrescine transport system ATP-binding protein